MKLGKGLGLQCNKKLNSQKLDSILSGPVAGYSFRYLNSSYVGDVILVERSSDNTTRGFKPSEITDGTLTTWVGPGNDGYADLYDQFGSNTATQFDNCLIVESGTLVTDPDTGKPALKLIDAGGAIRDRLQITPPYSANQQYVYIFSVFSLGPTYNNFPQLINGDPTDRGLISIFEGSTRKPRTGTVRSSGNSVQSAVSALTAGNAYIRIDSADRTNVKCRINGSEVINIADKNSDFNMPVTIYIGNTESTIVASEIYLSEVIFSTANESANTENAESEINSYYSIY